MIKTILFDLDGTLLPMNEELFEKSYFTLLCRKVAPLGYEPKKLLQSILKCTEAVKRNDGKDTNEAVFWKGFTEIYGDKVLEDKDKFNEFYSNEFNLARNSCGYEEKAGKTIRALKRSGYTLILATNPIFPKAGTYSRVKWAGLAVEDFSYITTYENSSFCKPNLDYYRQIVGKFQLDVNECLIIGNDAEEDMIATELGLKGFLLTDNLINRKNIDINKFPNGGYPELWEFLNKELDSGFKPMEE